MKSLKAAAVVAGSLALAGVAGPAFAHDTADVTPTSLNGAFHTLTKGPLEADSVMPLRHQSDALNTEHKDSVLHTVKGTTIDLDQDKLLGGLPLRH